MDPLNKAAEEKCLSFEEIHNAILGSNICSDQRVKLSLRTNSILDKPEAAEVSIDNFRINISANVSTHPESGEIINNQPFEVISWEINTFKLEEGCETPPDGGITRKSFSDNDESIKYFLEKIAIYQSRS